MIDDDDNDDVDDDDPGHAPARVARRVRRATKAPVVSRNRRRLMAAVAVVVLIAVAVAAVALRHTPLSYAATINGVAISRNTINEALADISINKQYVQEVDQQGSPGPVAGTSKGTYNITFVAALLNQQIHYEVIRQALVAMKAAPTAAQTATAKTEVTEDFPSGVFSAFPARYQAVLVAQQADVDAFVVKSTGDLTSAALNQYYQAHLTDYATASCVRHILIADTDSSGQIDYSASLADAQKIKALLEAGGDFASLAKQYSADNSGSTGGSAAQGGMLMGSGPNGCLNGSDLESLDNSLPAFAEAVVTLPVNVVSAPVETQLGYHLIEVTSRTIEPLDTSVIDDIHQTLAGNQLNTLLGKTKVKVNPEYGTYNDKPDASGQIVGVVPPSTVPANTTTSAP